MIKYFPFLLFSSFCLANDITGTYSSVTESGCNLEIQLASKGKAQVKQFCVAEDGSHKMLVEKYSMDWKRNGDLAILMGKNNSGKLKLKSYISYKSLGIDGGSRGLVVVEGPLFRSYGKFWLIPIPSGGR